MTNNYDAIIVGGGHNGLVCAAYLAKAGRKVLLLEAAKEVGGAAKTEEFCAGKKVSSCAHFLNQLSPKVRDDLNLTGHGLNFTAANLDTIALATDGKHLKLSRNDVSGEEISASERLAYQSLLNNLHEYAGALNFLLEQPPLDIFNSDFTDKKNALVLGWKLRFGLGGEKMSEFLRQVGMNIYDVVEDELENELLKGALSFDAVLGTHTGPRSPGSVFTYLYRIVSGERGALQLPKGGMGTVTQAIKNAAMSAGAEVRTGARVANVNVENCVVAGVTLENGEMITSKVVVSNLDPKSTVLDLVGARHFEADFVHRINCIRSRGNAAKLHLALNELPEFVGIEREDLANRLLIAPSSEEVERAFNHVKYKESSIEPMMEISIPSIIDRTLTQEGHVLSAIVQYAPYDLKGGWTEEARTAFLDKCIDRIAQYAPTIRKSIEHAELLTPKDIEKRYGTTGGNWHHGELTLDQMLMLRPVPGASRYALPLEGMYLCGAGAHPGGGVMGAAGHNAAHAILNGEGA